MTKDKLLQLPYEDLAVIINDYELANCYQPIYTNTACNVDKLVSEGKKMNGAILNDFAFLTVNRYNVIEPVADIEAFVDFDNELVPYVNANEDKYKNLFPVEDSAIKDRHFDKDYVLKRLEGPFPDRSTQLEAIHSLLSEAELYNQKLGNALYDIEGEFKLNHIDFSKAKELILKAYEELQDEESEIDEERFKTAESIEKDVMAYVEKFRTNQIAMAKFNRYYEPLKEKFLSGEHNQDQYENNLKILIKNCLSGSSGDDKYQKALEGLKVSCPEIKAYLKEVKSEYGSLEKDQASDVRNTIIKLNEAVKKSTEAKDTIVRGIKTIKVDEFVPVLISICTYNVDQIIEYFGSKESKEKKQG